MDDLTAGELATFLEDNPGRHRFGNSVVKHVATFSYGDEWLSDLTNP